MSASFLRLVHSAPEEWPYRRRRRLARRVQLMLDCSMAVWDHDGIEACLKTAADYPDDWQDIAREEGVW